MVYYFIVSLPFLIFFSHLLLTNILIPYFKKRSLCLQLSTRDEWSSIESTERTLQTLFLHEPRKKISLKYRNLDKESMDFIYGEIDFLAFYSILEKVTPQPSDVFYDLGSGTGKAVFAAAFFFDIAHSRGIELVPNLSEKAKKNLHESKCFFQDRHSDLTIHYLENLSKIEFIQGSFLTYDFKEASMIYIAATSLNHDTWEDLVEKLTHLNSGTRVIVATKRIEHDRFDLIYHGIELMSWGLCPVNIYRIA